MGSKDCIIGDIKKNESNFIRVSIKTFKEVVLVDIRQCFYDDRKEVRYTTKGISIKPEHLKEIFGLLKEAYVRLQDDKKEE